MSAEKAIILEFVGGLFKGELRSDALDEDEAVYVESTYEGAVGKRFTCLSPSAVEEMQNSGGESMKGSMFSFHTYKVVSKSEDEQSINPSRSGFRTSKSNLHKLPCGKRLLDDPAVGCSFSNLK